MKNKLYTVAFEHIPIYGLYSDVFTFINSIGNIGQL